MDKIKSYEVTYKMYNIKSCFNNAVKINIKRKSDDITAKKNLLLLNKSISNEETAGESNIKKTQTKLTKKHKKICIKFQDLVVESEKSKDSDNHLELALLIKTGKYKKKTSANICPNKNISLKIEKKKSTKNKPKLNNSMCKVELGCNNKENIIIKKFKKIFCC